MSKRVSGYIRKLSSSQIVDACKLAREGAFTPEVAKRFDLTINECIHMLNKELVGKENIRFKKYGKKQYNWKDPNVIEMLKRLMAAGNNDDEIAALLETSFVAVARGRSTAGLVKFNRIIAKGHQTPHEYSHLIDSVKKSFEEEQLTLFDNNNEPVLHGLQTQIIHNNKNQTIVENNSFRQKVKHEDSNIRVRFLQDEVPSEIKQKLVEKISWRSILMRYQNINHLYVIEQVNKIYYFKQLDVDPYTGFVTIGHYETVNI